MKEAESAARIPRSNDGQVPEVEAGEENMGLEEEEFETQTGPPPDLEAARQKEKDRQERKKEAKEKMLSEYDENCSRINDPKIEDERNNLVPLFELGTKKFQDYAYRWRLIDYQRKIEGQIEDIPFIGYTDFYFEDNHTREDFFIDLKTSKNLPQKISISHAMQQAIYQKATNAKQILWYLKTPTKTKDAEYIAMSLDDYVEPFNICKHIIKVMGNYLKTVDTPEDVKNSLVPNPDNWIWKEPTVLEARKEVWGY
mgnify:CR=1 FL=1